ncbi:MAG: hypothetical protein FJW30_03530 [Acidobacteria bacterium]|nr:hypothetical protein [Acidobacteriota bacterium]
MERRSFLALGAFAQGAERGGGLALNEDSNHFFSSRAGQRLTAADVSAFVDQYAGTQVQDLLFNVNAMRAGFPSTTRSSFWDGYDPNGPDTQPLFASVKAEEAKSARAWVHQAWQLHWDGIDVYKLWLARARKHRIGAWVSIRMNDLHNVDDERHYLHSAFWKEHPELRRVPYRGEQRDRALDYLRPEVREHNFALIDEVATRYGFDGMELDWMRFGFHLAPGREAEGARVLTDFHRRVRARLGSRKKIAVRAPSRPETAARLGLDVLAWAREGLVDVVTVTNFWRTVDNDMPIALWRSLLPARVKLNAGLELGLNAFPGSIGAGGRAWQSNSLETVRGSAWAYLEQGADGIYLFNYMDSQTAMDNNSTYPALLREAGRKDTLRGKVRRHVVTYQDTWAPGEKPAHKLPVDTEAGRWFAIRIPVGETKGPARLRLGVRGADPRSWEVRLNGVLSRFAGVDHGLRPGPDVPVYGFAAGISGPEIVVDAKAGGPGRVEWAEIVV